MSRTVALAILLSALACSAHKSVTSTKGMARKGGDRALFVGHTSTGEVVVAANHYNSMNGLAVMAGDIDATDVNDGRQMLCSREEITGSHFPHWICRYKDEAELQSEADRARARAFLSGAPKMCGNCENR